MKIKINPKLKSFNLSTIFQSFCLIFFSFIFSCSPTKKLQKTKVKEYQNLVQNSPVFDQGFTGFQLYDPATGEVLFSLNDDKYFTPASNTKIFTFYTALNVLGDSIPAFKYFTASEFLIFWGTGDPSFLHPQLTQNEQVIRFLKNRKETLIFSPYNFQDERFGPGWAWDDYNDSYQPEKSSFPIYGNLVQFEKARNVDTFEIFPAFFDENLIKNIKLNSTQIKRQIDCNIFEFNPDFISKSEYEKSHPFKYSDSLICQLLSEVLSKKVTLLDAAPPSNATNIYSVHADSLYRMLMQESDNFIAEQLLLLCANALFDTLNASKTIQFAKDSLLADLPDQANWVDGSGLSRYNMFTPRSIVFLLDKLYKKIPQKRLFHIFPAGGESGTIAEYYKGDEKPYVFAKTGTLRNKHCLSGYLVTKTDKVLIFSLMHNNFPNGSAVYKKEMERVLEAIYLAY